MSFVDNNLIDDMAGTNRIIDDGWFKAVAKYKLIASILIKYTVEEYKMLSVEEIAKLIIDTKHNKTADVLEHEIDMVQSESGDKGERGIRHDVIFLVRSTKDVKRLANKVTMNFEIQSSHKNYNMISRAIYYTSHLLKNTIHKGDNYDSIHKVYSIWFCNFELGSEIEMHKEIEDRFIHRYQMCRHYEDLHKVSIDPVGDLMEAVMVELPKMKKSEIKEYNMIYQLFFNTNHAVEAIEQVTKINLSKYKEVREMFDAAEAMVKSRQEGRQEGKVESALFTFNIMANAYPNKSKDQIISEIAHGINLDEQAVKYLRKLIDENQSV